MKFRFALVIAVLAGMLSGCGSSEPQDPAPKGERPQVNDAPAGAVPPGDTRGEAK